MERCISVVIEGVRIGTDHQEGFHELWKWKLTDGIATNQGGFAVASQMEGGSSSFHDCLKFHWLERILSLDRSRLTFNLTKS